MSNTVNIGNPHEDVEGNTPTPTPNPTPLERAQARLAEEQQLNLEFQDLVFRADNRHRKYLELHGPYDLRTIEDCIEYYEGIKILDAERLEAKTREEEWLKRSAQLRAEREAEARAGTMTEVELLRNHVHGIDGNVDECPFCSPSPYFVGTVD